MVFKYRTLLILAQHSDCVLCVKHCQAGDGDAKNTQPFPRKKSHCGGGGVSASHARAALSPSSVRPHLVLASVHSSCFFLHMLTTTIVETKDCLKFHLRTTILETSTLPRSICLVLALVIY